MPPGSLGEFLKFADERCQELSYGVKINAFGHLADGNVHYNLSPPPGQQDFSNVDDEISMMLCKLATLMKGSFAAEHGIGRAKLAIADDILSAVERDLMSCIKSSIDGTNQLNPGVLVRIS